MLKIVILPLVLLSFNDSKAFDLEDYATTYRATRDAYLQAQNELVTANDFYNQSVNALKANCIKVIEPQSKAKNLEGVINGACNRDGEGSYVNGGVKTNIHKEKLGDLWFKLADRIPALGMAGDWHLGATPPRIPGFFGDMEDGHTRFRSARDAIIQSFYRNNPRIRLERIAGCTPTNSAISKILQRAKENDPNFCSQRINWGMDVTQEQCDEMQLRDVAINQLEDRMQSAFDSVNIAASNAVLATAPFQAAMDAYHTATSLYTQSLDSAHGQSLDAGWKLVVDPVLPPVDWAW